MHIDMSAFMSLFGSTSSRGIAGIRGNVGAADTPVTDIGGTPQE
jgi:hypothetical protein